MFVITSGVNVPLNDQLAKAGDPARIADLTAARRDFEARWVTWNTVRAVANIAAFAVLAWALVLHGRTTASSTTAEPTAGASVTAAAPADVSGPGVVSYGSGAVPYGSGVVAYGSGPGSYRGGTVPYRSGAVAYGTGTGGASAPS